MVLYVVDHGVLVSKVREVSEQWLKKLRVTSRILMRVHTDD